jgi:hypothetical protein
MIGELEKIWKEISGLTETMKGLSEVHRCPDPERSERNGVLTCWVETFRTVNVFLCLTKHYYTVKAYGRWGRIVQVEVNLRPTVTRPVCLGARRPSGTRDQFFFLLEMSCRQLQVSYFVAPSLTTGRVCNLLYNCFWALPEQSLLGRSPAELTTIFNCLIWDSPNLEGQVPVFVSPWNRVAQLYPRALGSHFVASYDSQGYGGGILTRLHTGQNV